MEEQKEEEQTSLKQDGFLLIDKPKGITSYDVIRKLKEKSNFSKIGHTGTLDPLTSGLLVICIGKATKLIDKLSIINRKEYKAMMKFGLHSDSYDIDGKIIKKDEKFRLSSYTEREIIDNFKTMEIEYDQIPPIYSAKKINGKRAYEYARENKEIKLKAKKINIYKLSINKIDFENQQIEFIAEVSKGTYIRSLIVDIAKKFDTIAVMSDLIRTKTDGFKLERAHHLNKVKQSDIILLSSFLEDTIMNKYIAKDKILHLLKNGVTIKNLEIIELIFKNNNKQEKEVLIYNEVNKLIALYERKDEILKVKYML